MSTKMVKILSIDAWASQSPDGDDCPSWDWNDWYTVGTFDLSILDGLDRQAEKSRVIDHFIAEGYLKPTAMDLVDIDDDQYNLVIVEKENRRPLYAIEYMGELQ